MSLETYKIKPNETIIDSDWITPSNHLTREKAVEVQNRIHWLTSNYLEKLVSANWKNLYIDRNDNRFWELTVSHGYMHGGGLPLLRCIDKETALSEYGFSLAQSGKKIEAYKIKSNETIIDSNWTNPSNHLTKEKASEIKNRIDWLINNYLEKLAAIDWTVLYIDRNDNRFWELTYPKSYMHGGIPLLLKNIDEETALSKYGFSL